MQWEGERALHAAIHESQNIAYLACCHTLSGSVQGSTSDAWAACVRGRHNRTLRNWTPVSTYQTSCINIHLLTTPPGCAHPKHLKHLDNNQTGPVPVARPTKTQRISQTALFRANPICSQKTLHVVVHYTSLHHHTPFSEVHTICNTSFRHPTCFSDVHNIFLSTIIFLIPQYTIIHASLRSIIFFEVRNICNTWLSYMLLGGP